MMRGTTTLTRVVATAVAVALAACSDTGVSRNATSPTDAPEFARNAPDAAAGGVYTMTNGATANAVLAFARASNGTLTSIGAFPTGGRGTGGAVDPLQSQYSVLLSDDNHWLFVVDAGSNDVAVYEVRKDASLELTDRVSSGGTTPISIAAHGSLVYVLNAGDNTVSGFHLAASGHLIPLPNSTQALTQGAAGASTIRFAPSGDWLIVTERDANRLETFGVKPNGRLGDPVVTASHGQTPFGFDITVRDQPIVSEAAGAAPDGALSSYSIGPSGSLSVITGSVDTGGATACWAILTSDGRFAFVSNAGSNTVASFSVASTGALALISGAAATTGLGPIDLDVAGAGLLYVLEAGAGAIGGFSIGTGGTLSAISVTSAGAPASGTQGLAAF